MNELLIGFTVNPSYKEMYVSLPVRRKTSISLMSRDFEFFSTVRKIVQLIILFCSGHRMPGTQFDAWFSPSMYIKYYSPSSPIPFPQERGEVDETVLEFILFIDNNCAFYW